MEYESENRYEDEPRYDRERSASPRGARRDDDYAGKGDDSYRGGRDRSASPNGHADSRGGPANGGGKDSRDAGAANEGSNLFVTGIAPSLTESEVSGYFEKYGIVESCSIMKDPHTQDSRGFGFVKMTTAEEADAAKEGLQGQDIQGRTLSIEKARRARPRTPTPGKYFGPPKRDDFRRGPPRGGRFDRDDRRGYGGGRYDDYRGGRYDDRYARSGGYGGGRRDDYGGRGGGDRYSSGRDDRYRDDYRGRDYGSRDGGRGYDAPPRDSYGGGGGGRDRDYPADDRYSRR